MDWGNAHATRRHILQHNCWRRNRGGTRVPRQACTQSCTLLHDGHRCRRHSDRDRWHRGWRRHRRRDNRRHGNWLLQRRRHLGTATIRADAADEVRREFRPSEGLLEASARPHEVGLVEGEFLSDVYIHSDNRNESGTFTNEAVSIKRHITVSVDGSTPRPGVANVRTTHTVSVAGIPMTKNI